MRWIAGGRRGGRRLGAVAGGLTMVAAGLAAGVPGAAASDDGAAGAPRRFLVTLRDPTVDPAAVAAEHSRRHGGEVAFVYRHALNGYAATFAGGGAAEVARDARVARVEPDGPVRVSTTQTGVPWGLDRIDQRAAALTNSFTYTNTGAGVTAYVIDTGIRFSHAEFGGRATSGYDALAPGTPADDCHGHGTHVAGTVGGTSYGVAKGVGLVAVRVLDCAGEGTISGVVAGVDWVTGHHVPGSPAVANMSLGGSASSTLDDAVRASIADRVTYVVAAGNGNAFGATSACNESPARVTEAITVSATDNRDRKASWANYGTCVDWFAPGVDIVSASSETDAGTSIMSGTSMAAPHTAGVAALRLQARPSAGPAGVRNALYNKTTKSIVTSANTTNNHLLFTRF